MIFEQPNVEVRASVSKFTTVSNKVGKRIWVLGTGNLKVNRCRQQSALAFSRKSVLELTTRYVF